MFFWDITSFYSLKIRKYFFVFCYLLMLLGKNEIEKSFENWEKLISTCVNWRIFTILVWLFFRSTFDRQDSIRSDYMSDREGRYGIVQQASLESTDSRLCYLTSSEVSKPSAIWPYRPNFSSSNSLIYTIYLHNSHNIHNSCLSIYSFFHFFFFFGKFFSFQVFLFSSLSQLIEFLFLQVFIVFVNFFCYIFVHLEVIGETFPKKSANFIGWI